MKTLFIILAFVVCANRTTAQRLSFDETVKYIEDKLECCRDPDWYREIKDITKTGRITIIRSGFKETVYDIFELFPDIEGADSMHKGTNGSLWFKGEVVMCFQTELDAVKVLKAFKHLKTLCEKEKDPFDN